VAFRGARAFALSLVTLNAGCQFSAAGTNVLSQPLSAPPPGVQASMDYDPPHPFVQVAPSVLSETDFVAPLQPGLFVEIRELLVLPSDAAVELPLPGAAILQVQSGSGVLSHAGGQERLHPGSVVAVSQGENLAIANPHDAPMRMRVQLFGSK
jgi:hypothetical protein